MAGYTTRERIDLGRSNTIDLLLKVDGVNADLSNVTRMVLQIGTVVMDSDLLSEGVGAHFDWTPGDGIVKLRLGDQALIPGYYDDGSLIVYDSSNPLGVMWDRRIQFEVVSA